MTAKTLLLMDGAALAYRAFYAIQNLSTRAGQPTNAVFGFVRMANQLASQWRPTHRAVVFDAGLPAARMALLPSYKQQREKMPDPLRSQFPLIEEYLRRAGIPALRVAGQEADDTMASLATLAAAEEADTLLATSDKDLFQLVTDRVVIVAPTAAGGRMGPAEVCAKMGVPPALVVELLALTGDTVDNIPGVPGVGPKTAAKLLTEFGSLAGLWARLAEVAGEKDARRARRTPRRCRAQRAAHPAAHRPRRAGGLDGAVRPARAGRGAAGLLS
jgi:DNA polymerase-1